MSMFWDKPEDGHFGDRASADVLILTESSTGWHSRQLEEAFRRMNRRVRFRSIRSLGYVLSDEPCQNPDWVGAELVMVRGIPGGSLEQVIMRMDGLRHLEQCGTRVMNRPGAIERTVDKFFTSSLLWNQHIRTPATFSGEDPRMAMDFFDRFRDVVCKPLFGSSGNGVVRITAREEATEAFQQMAEEQKVIYMQQYLEHGTEDLRVLVVNGQVLCAMKRRAAGWITNISRGASPEHYEPEEEIKILALQSVKALGLDYAGVDILIHREIPYVVEVNSSPAWKGLQQAAGFQVADALVEHLLAMRHQEWEDGDGDPAVGVQYQGSRRMHTPGRLQR